MPSEVLSVHFLVIPNSCHHVMGKKMAVAMSIAEYP